MSSHLPLAVLLTRRAGVRHQAVADSLLVAFGVGVMALSAQIRIPLQPVPFTLQTFVLMAMSLALGTRLGALTQATYLVIGALGLPVFSGGSSGIAALVGPTGGYLASFLVVAFWLGFVAQRGWDAKPLTLAAALTVGIALNLGLGWAQLSLFVGAKAAFAVGVAPFVFIEVAKAMVAAGLMPSLTHLVRRTKPE